jgi:23S rRNA-/tRNA-specific pseudouridylate synthase
LCLPSEDGVPSLVETVFEYIQQQQTAKSSQLESNEITLSTLNYDETATNATTVIINNEDDPMRIQTTTTSSALSERVQAMDQMIVHRLGYDTAGLLVLAKTIPAVRALNILFRTRPSIPLSSTTTTNKKPSSDAKITLAENKSENENVVQQPNDVVTESTDDSIVDVHGNFAERLNQIGIIRQYEVLVAGHVRPQINATTESQTSAAEDDVYGTNHTTDAMTTRPPPHGGYGWIHLPLMRCYEYPPYMRVSTPEQQQLLLSLDPTMVGKKLLEAPKSSLTYYEIMKYEYYQNNPSLPVTRMTLTSMTGRTHQLNVHCTYYLFCICTM